MGRSENPWIYSFGGGKADGDASQKALLGGKGANLAEMARLGLPVPAGFTLTTEVCNYYGANGSWPEGLVAGVSAAVAKVEGEMGGKLGDPSEPLLLSVRSGARASMPGMMDTVLDLGLNDRVAERWSEVVGARFVYDAYRRLVQMYGDVVLDVHGPEGDPFALRLEQMKKEKGVAHDLELDADDLRLLTEEFKEIVHRHTGRDFPQEPEAQLWGAIEAVFRSWNNERAVTYRRLHDLPSHWGTAANVQAMVFGNRGEGCATGVAFTRDPSTGEPLFYGEYLDNAQGEDVVAGIRTPKPLNEASRSPGDTGESMEKAFPEAYEELRQIRGILEDHYRDMQDVEFTIEHQHLWMLQTRNGKRTGPAAVRIAVDMLDEGRIDEPEALVRVEPQQLTQLLLPVFDRDAQAAARSGGRLLARGLAAGPGAATGELVLSAEEAVARVARGAEVVLVRVETSPEDIQGMHAARGILTARGGMTSHAAVVARGMGKTCVAGCGELEIDYAAGEVKVAGKVLAEGDPISLDGSTGEVFEGQLEVRSSEVFQVLRGELDAADSRLYRDYRRLIEMAEATAGMGVRTNADTPHDAEVARQLGANGIGLCRTEHMFFEDDRIDAVRRMILAEDEAGRRKALDELLPMQQGDFEGIFRAMDGLPVTIRTLDPPLHEFLPHTSDEITELAAQMGLEPTKLAGVVALLSEANPMLGHRGCRLGIAFPEITAMQAEAIFRAAVKVAGEGIEVRPEIMIPLVGHVRELELQRQ
ncbi:MAG: pyruvate, phosphate dikinase, partial [Holophagales bacterium]|nr:pyruvate, phosphate dikinase [Holophagales bacterium]